VGAELAAIRATRVNLVLFLEGTSTDGRDVRPFKSSLLEPAAAGGWPVAPVALAYATPSPAAVETAICWWGDMKLIPHLLGLLALPQVTAKIFFGEARPASSDRKELAKGLQKQVLHMKDLLNTAVSDHDTLSVGETYAKVYHASDR
jgi:1-acyl-sn-glycerol-3-phosphate acyltransferase